MPIKDAARIRAVFTDIDDTLTIDGRVTADAYSAMWALHDAGIAVIPVTGRPAGWCDLVARQWPVAGVVGENGAFYFRYDQAERTFVRRFVLSEDERKRIAGRLKRLEKKILAAVPGAAVASDQAYRIHDLAIDFCEDVPRLSATEVDKIVELFTRAGATAKVSSIHVNGWFGDWDKVSMIKAIGREVLSLDLDRRGHNRRAVYVGDSPNDEPAFELFAHSVGVANIREFASRLAHPPTYVTRGEGGRGFKEVAMRLIRARAR